MIPKEEVSKLELTDRVVSIRRVAKVVKGGRRFSFSALVVVGDQGGYVGYGLGKANQVPDAIRKAVECAKKSLIKVPIINNTIPFPVKGIYGAGKVIVRPAPEGTGVIAGGAVRAVVESAGVKNINAKCIGSNNPHNVVKATMEAFKLLRTPESIAAKRGKKLEDIL